MGARQTTMPTARTLTERVGALWDLYSSPKWLPKVHELWDEVRADIPAAAVEYIMDIDYALRNSSTRSKTDQRIAREKVLRLMIWVEGYEAGIVQGYSAGKLVNLSLPQGT